MAQQATRSALCLAPPWDPEAAAPQPQRGLTREQVLQSPWFIGVCAVARQCMFGALNASRWCDGARSPAGSCLPRQVISVPA